MYTYVYVYVFYQQIIVGHAWSLVEFRLKRKTLIILKIVEIKEKLKLLNEIII